MVTGQRIGVAAASAVILSLTACGGSSHPSSASYVHTVCSAMRTFGSKITAQASKLSAAGQANASNAQALQKATSAFLNQGAADGTEAVQTIDRLGSPNISNGPAIQATILGAFQQLTTSYRAEAQTVAKLNASKKTTFYKQLQQIGSTSQELGYSITSILEGKNGLGSPELSAARAKDSTCGSLH